MKKNSKTRLEMEEEILGRWKEDAEEAEQKMMKAKSKRTVKKWSRRLQVCGMYIRDLEDNIKNLKREEKEGSAYWKEVRRRELEQIKELKEEKLGIRSEVEIRKRAESDTHITIIKKKGEKENV